MSKKSLYRFTGDWTTRVFYAVKIDYDGHGWVVPTVTRAQLDRIVSDQWRLFHGDGENDILTMHGDELHRTFPDDPYDPEVRAYVEIIDPNPDGTYTLTMDWCWQLAPAPDPTVVIVDKTLDETGRFEVDADYYAPNASAELGTVSA